MSKLLTRGARSHLRFAGWSRKVCWASIERLDRWTRYQPRWPHPVLFIAGLPKSGTEWLMRLVAAVPGYKVRRPYDPDRCADDHDVCDAIFANLPWTRHSVIKLHTKCTETNIEVIRRFDLKTVVVFRDLRDQCVSRYFHILNDPTHRHHAQYRESSKEAALAHCIEVTLAEYVPWIQGWLPYLAQQPDRFHEVRYEQLRADPVGVLARVLEFYDIRLQNQAIRQIVEDCRATTKFDLEGNLRWGKGTARKGLVGDWRNNFNEDHERRFASAAGEFLVELGYERRTTGST